MRGRHRRLGRLRDRGRVHRHDGGVGLRGVGHRVLLPAVLGLRRLSTRTTTRTTRPTATARRTTRGPAPTAAAPSAYGPYGGAGVGARYNPRTGTYSRGAAACGPYGARGAATAYNPRTGAYGSDPPGLERLRQLGRDRRAARRRLGAHVARRRTTRTGNTTRVTQGSGGGEAITRSGPAGGRQRRRADRQRRRLRRPRRQRLRKRRRQLAEVRQRRLEQRRQAREPSIHYRRALIGDGTRSARRRRDGRPARSRSCGPCRRRHPHEGRRHLPQRRWFHPERWQLPPERRVPRRRHARRRSPAVNSGGGCRHPAGVSHGDHPLRRVCVDAVRCVRHERISPDRNGSRCSGCSSGRSARIRARRLLGLQEHVFGGERRVDGARRRRESRHPPGRRVDPRRNAGGIAHLHDRPEGRLRNTAISLRSSHSPSAGGRSDMSWAVNAVRRLAATSCVRRSARSAGPTS